MASNGPRMDLPRSSGAVQCRDCNLYWEIKYVFAVPKRGSKSICIDYGLVVAPTAEFVTSLF